MPVRHPGWEYGIVLQGTLGVALAFEEYLLHPGDSISFESTTPHRPWNAGEVPVEGICVVAGRHPARGIDGPEVPPAR